MGSTEREKEGLLCVVLFGSDQFQMHNAQCASKLRKERKPTRTQQKMEYRERRERDEQTKRFFISIFMWVMGKIVIEQISSTVTFRRLFVHCDLTFHKINGNGWKCWQQHIVCYSSFFNKHSFYQLKFKWILLD